ncbi:hypothetical protein HUJ04_012791 [Dendroctonus ponderosae]|uniref:Histone-lysine N-methyltransferase n=1 Tax=Dendroctonus ponderosae TaxID=77166 RepID=A0AAR5PVR5_DENPD|nr:hypothetical protein HUJ04_012791 [Dendroctonus ponderosae]
MGRSKFPGKPSKHCHKKRINVLPPTGELNQEGDSSSVTVIGASKENKQEDVLSGNEGESKPQTQKARPLRRRLSRKLSTTIRTNGRQRNFISKIRGKAALKNNRTARNNLAKGHARKETTNFAGKFVLPKRSVHSSRVIKPNKRFIDLNETLNIKKKGLAKRAIKQSEDQSNTSESDAKDTLAFSNGHRVILRQARLKLPNQVSTQGPFSSNLHNGPGTIICGVCGAVRYYRFVKQARKFNIYSCESCRKFIAKQIKRQNVGSQNSSVLICIVGQGTCYVPPVERSQHWKISKCAYRSRCPACWLKMCLKAYHLPLTLKQNLTQLLPKNMRGLDFSFSNSLPPILWQRNVQSPLGQTETVVKQRPVRFKPPQKSQISIPPVTSDVKRQKIDLKGPRVKHVCRSASIVLGQPLAMFGVDTSVKKTTVDSSDLLIERNASNDALKVNDLCKFDFPSITDEDISSNSGSCKSFYEKSIMPKKERTKSLPIPSIKQPSIMSASAQKGIILNNSHELNLENRFNVGFSLVTTKEISTSAMCFVCGSAGLDNMLVCCICCEPYHIFCMEEIRAPIISKKDWVCIQCTPCQECQQVDKIKVSCPKCLKLYHSDCLTSQNDDNSPNMICKDCTKCQDCGTPTAYNLSSFPGNMPLCLNCLDKKRIGKHCPICQHSFEENSLTKMLECSKCKRWVHADCEKLTSEQYDILKLLPVSANFSCSQCLGDDSNVWHKAVQSEMHRCFRQVLKLLVKNKPVKNILKRIGFKGSSFRKFMATKSLDIDNNNYNKNVDQIYSFDESEKQLVSSSCSVNTLLDIKCRLCEYSSVKRFDQDMQDALRVYDSEQVVLSYRSIFESVFPWFSPLHKAAENVPLLPYRHLTCESSQLLPNNAIFPKKELDNRMCKLCQNTGDGLSNQESRLLYCGNNSWVHANCAYWSTNVFEQMDNQLQNVIDTIESSKSTQCSICGKFGASIQCHLCRSSSYHFMCARKADFRFRILDKASFCSKHQLEKSNYFLNTEDFEVNRALFIEQHPKEAIRCDPEKVTCLIGSLCITNLGKIEPILSDTADAIIPTGFICTRLFWSTKEPWKLVSYIITTSIQNPNCTIVTVDKNFTIDHSLEQIKIDQAMKELNDWRRICDKKSDDLESEDEEEKNGTELLSPELTDTILEELPHDILDGILVQDIFSNFSYEDMLNLDNSNTESITESLKKPDDEDSCAETSDFRSAGKELVRPRIPPLSLTVSYKVDSSHPSPPKKRKISKETPANLLLLQVDGAFDDSSSECGSPIGTDTIDAWGPISEEPVTCEKCQCTYRTQASYKRHLDSCEVLCTSESDSENMADFDSHIHCEEETTIVVSQPIEVSQPTQPVLIQAFESYQSQVHTSVVNIPVPEPTPAPPLVPSQQISVQPTITITDPAPISISVPLCVAPSMTPQIVQPSIDFQQQQAHPMALQPMQQVLVQRTQSARREPMVIQQMPPATTSGFVPFVDTFAQPQANQSVQYVQLAPQVQSQPQLLQIRPDGSVVGILPSIQPTTVIVQQPQQLVLDSSGTFGWAQQPQPQIYYGFETIVQNTVMQSQQFLPTPVPGVLTANSSYSTTTQVFQTSKLEPVLDVSSNSFVLVNSSGQLEIPQQFSQGQPATVVTSQTPTLIYSSQPSTTQKSLTTAAQNCINLPTAPFVSDQNIPMNVVPPIPKPPTSHGRPMSRVLPMPTNAIRASRKIADATKLFPEVEKPSQIKMDDKFVFPKDLMKIIDTPKARNRKFEILDYKIIKAQSKLEECKVFSVEDNPLRDFEPSEKFCKLSTYEPLKEVEKVQMEIFEKPLKSAKFDSFKSNHFNKTESVQKRTRMDIVAINKNSNIEVIPPRHQIDQCFHELEKRFKIINNIKEAHLPVENVAKKLEPYLEKSSLLAPSKKTANFCLKNNGNTRALSNVDKSQKLNMVPPLEALPKQTFIDNAIQSNVARVHQNADIFITGAEVTQDKLLDMPQLDDLLKVEKPEVSDSKPLENQSLSFFDIQPEETVAAHIGRQPAPLLSVKPQLIQSPLKQEKETLKSIEGKANNIPEPKQTPRKETEPTGAPSIVYTMENKEGFRYSSTSISDCWAKVLEAVQLARAAHNMPPLPTDGKQMKSVQITGLKSSHVKYLVEQLPGASKCVKYKPLYKFTPHPYDTAELCSHGFGAVRCQPHETGNSDPYDMFSWLSSKHRGPFTSLGSQAVQSRRVNNFPMAMKFKNLKLTSRYSVGVYRSRIHGKGLFCLRDIEPGEMVIEYAGEVIRSILTDKREKFYNSKGIGCYMFRVDDNFVVDATMKGNAARFINHSCDPNCYSKVVEIVGHKHIIIFALRRILSGEELTYDYKFPFEEDKIPCTCGAKRCRKFLN